MTRARTMLKDRRRILVLGSGGAGKSTFARRLGEITGLPVVHLDAHYWRPGWKEPDASEWSDQVRALSAGERWIMDGNFSKTLSIRIARCDAIVFLDFSRWTCLRGALGRWWRGRGEVRSDMAPGCPECVDPKFLLWVWRFPKRSRPDVLRALDEARSRCEVVVARSRREAAEVLDHAAKAWGVSMPEPLEFPAGVRLAKRGEGPKEWEEGYARASKARITTGYRVTASTRPDFTSVFEINAHASRVHALVRDLAVAILPDVAAPIVCIKDDEPTLGPYTDRDRAIDVFEPHVRALQHDGLVEYGIIFQVKGETEEVYVKSSKCIHVWTKHTDAVRSVLRRHGIPEVPRLEFIDEYPMISTSRTPDGNAAWPLVVEPLRTAFDALPRR